MLGPVVGTKLKIHGPCSQHFKLSQREKGETKFKVLSQRLAWLVLEGAHVWFLDN